MVPTAACLTALAAGLLLPVVAEAQEPEPSDEELLDELRPRPSVALGLRASPLGGNRHKRRLHPGRVGHALAAALEQVELRHYGRKDIHVER